MNKGIVGTKKEWPMKTMYAWLTAVYKDKLLGIDPLTKLYNRNGMNDKYGFGGIDQELLNASRNNKPMTFLFWDVVDFKRFNDTHGHAAGDRRLKAVADALKDGTRETDINYRWGGEEFLSALIGADYESATRLILPKIYSLFKEIPDLDVSVGIKEWKPRILYSREEARAEAEKIIEEADARMYKHKLRQKDPRKIMRNSTRKS